MRNLRSEILSAWYIVIQYYPLFCTLFLLCLAIYLYFYPIHWKPLKTRNRPTEIKISQNDERRKNISIVISLFEEGKE